MRDSVSPETVAETIGGVVIALISGAGHDADAGPLAVQLNGVGLGVGVGDACPVDEEPPQAAVSPMRTMHPANQPVSVPRTADIMSASPTPP